MYTRKTMTHARLMCGVAAAAVLASAGMAQAQTQDQPAITIAPQSLATALYEFGGLTGRQVLFTPDIAAAKTTRGVAGATDQQIALAQLLEGTGLTWRRNGDTFLIMKADAGPQSGSAAGDGAEVEALIVTAQKREEDIQDVPIAISAFTQEALERSQIAGGPDLMTQVPNMTFTKTNFSSYSIQIRGIGTQAISATTDPAVAVAFNNTPFVRNRFFEQEFYDLERVEVLRGPQGTLYGRNATAGVVNIISAKPSFDFEAKLSADVSNFESRRLEGMVNIPIVQDAVALRLAGAWTKRNGFVTNEITGNPIDGRDLWSVRATLRFEPADWFRADLIYEHFQEDDDRLRSGKQLCKRDGVFPFHGIPGNEETGEGGGVVTAALFSQGCLPTSMYSDEAFQAPNGWSLPYYYPLSALGFPARQMDPYSSTTQSRDLRVIESTVDPHYTVDTDLAELQLRIDIGPALSLSSETSYGADFIFSTQDFNRFNTRSGIFLENFEEGGYGGFFPEGLLENYTYCDPQIGCADRLVAIDLSTAKSRQFSQEFRLSSDFDGPVNFSVGANFLRYDTEDKYYVFINAMGMFSAMGLRLVNNGLFPTYNPRTFDHRACLQNGMVPTDPLAAQNVMGCIYIDPNPIENLNDLGHNYFLSKNPYKLISYATFGELYWEVAPGLKLTGGLRWTVDKKQAPRIPSQFLVAESPGYPVAEVVDQEWREPTGRLTVDWKPDLAFSDETLIYASYAHGYKAGGANPPPAVLASYFDMEGAADALVEDSLTHPKTFAPEFIDAFEVGAKNTFLDGRMVLNLNAFYYDYEGYQISQIVNRSAVNLNFDAEVWGVELEADWRPLENLRLGFKGGYENTRVADGARAIDTMDRTAGDPNYTLLRPFPTVPSNCIVPTWLVTYGGNPVAPYQVGSNVGACVLAYIAGVDPVTRLPYTPYPEVSLFDDPYNDGNYPGFDPSTVPNNGEGIFKDLSGNELPNAPHYTATLTADFSLPLPNEWLMTLHSDVYYQSEAWTRIFNMEGYDKLKAYTNVNLAAIFDNGPSGWRVMAYVKNVFDRDSITGAFLLSDDTGLTTNVFLTEPRLYGLRVTKAWSGGGAPSGGGGHGGPYPLTVELGGSVLRTDAPNERLAPAFMSAFAPMIDPSVSQDDDLDWGDGREVRLTYRPAGAAWQATAAARFNEANGGGRVWKQKQGRGFCLYRDTIFAYVCDDEAWRDDPMVYLVTTDYGNTAYSEGEDHVVVDFSVGIDVGLGFTEGGSSLLSGGLRYARLRSTSDVALYGVPDWGDGAKYTSHHRYTSDIQASRSFEGVGPVITWGASTPLLRLGEANRLAIEWSVSGGALFGRRETTVQGQFEDILVEGAMFDTIFAGWQETPLTTPVSRRSSGSATVPVLDLSVGAGWTVDRAKFSLGYRWERYFDAIDGGYQKESSADRTIDGPYFKLAVGFGG